MKVLRSLYLAVLAIALQALLQTSQANASSTPTPVAAVRELGFKNGPTRLAGELATPANRLGPFPVLVVTAGSGPADRTGYGIVKPIRDAFLEKGFAVYTWDKPGTGESTGDHRNQPLNDRIAEVTEAVRMLRSQTDVRVDAIGLWGISQAGWVLPAVAAKLPDLAFLISILAPGGTGADQEIYRVENSMRADGYAEEEIREAVAFTRQRFAALSRGDSFGQICVMQDAVASSRWINEVGRYDEENYIRLRVPTPSPRAVLAQLRLPILAIYGERDRIVDWQQGYETYRAAAKEAGNQRLSVVTFPAADHAIFPTITGGQAELDAWINNPHKMFAPGYVHVMTDWARQVISDPKGAK